MANKMRKFERDTKDYLHSRVFTWPSERTQQRRMKKTSVSNSEKSSIGSDSSQPEHWKQSQNKKYTSKCFFTRE